MPANSLEGGAGAASQENQLARLRYQSKMAAGREDASQNLPKTPAEEKNKNAGVQSSDKSDQSTAANLKNLRNLAVAAKITKEKEKENKNDSIKNGIEKIGMKEATRMYLNGAWATVFLDWTTLTLWSLNIYFIISLFSDKFSKFGEDDIIGTWFGGGRLGKFNPMGPKIAMLFEIGLIVIMDLIILTIFIIILLLIYALVNPLDTFKYIFGL